MNREKLVREISKDILNKITIKNREFSIPTGVSNRHIHLEKGDLEILFGKDYELQVKSYVNQPGQFAANETLTIVGSKGAINNVRILGPLRKKSQIEISRSDSYALGINPPLRDSGDLENSESLCVVGPKGMKIIESCVICAKRHIHMTPDIAEKFGVKPGDYVQVETKKEKGVIFKNVLIRVSDNSTLEFHVDLDEANSCDLKNGDRVRILRLDG